MATLRLVLMGCSLLFLSTSVFAQDPIVETIEQAKTFYLEKSYQEAAAQLSRALELINNKLIEDLKSATPQSLSGWRADDASSSISFVSEQAVLTVKRSYFKEGGGPSVDIELVVNSIKIGNIKMMFSSPATLNRAGEGLKINTIANQRCIERFDPVDRYAEFIFVPTAKLLVTITGQEMKNTDLITKFAEKVNWETLITNFP
jgi:hypothetical protein